MFRFIAVVKHSSGQWSNKCARQGIFVARDRGLTPVVQKLDRTIYWINHYLLLVSLILIHLVNSTTGTSTRHPVSDESDGRHHLGPKIVDDKQFVCVQLALSDKHHSDV